MSIYLDLSMPGGWKGTYVDERGRLRWSISPNDDINIHLALGRSRRALIYARESRLGRRQARCQCGTTHHMQKCTGFVLEDINSGGGSSLLGSYGTLAVFDINKARCGQGRDVNVVDVIV